MPDSTIQNIKWKILNCPLNSIAILSLTAAALKVAIEVGITTLSSDYGKALGIPLLFFIAINLIYCAATLRDSTVRAYYSASVISSITVFAFALFLEQFAATDDADRILFALVGLSLAPFAQLQTTNSTICGREAQFIGFTIVLATQLALILLTNASSYNLWLTWILYLSFLLFVKLQNTNPNRPDPENNRVVSPEPSSSSLTPCAAVTVQEREMIAKLTEDNRIIHQLIGNVAHDLKTPLSSFMVGLGLIEDWIHDIQRMNKHFSTETLTLLNQIETALHDAQITDTFMIATIDRFIEYTKSTAGIKLTPKEEPVNIMDAVDFALLCMTHANTHFTFKALPIEADRIASHVFTDQQWLQENLLCLLSNAAKYSYTGEITVHVYLQPRQIDISLATPRSSAEENGRNSNQVLVSPTSPKTPHSRNFSVVSHPDCSHKLQDLVFEVEDHGIGVPEEKKPFLFGAFAQTQKMAGGTGLGLYSLAKRVQTVNGSYGVRSRRDGERGSCFWFAIPYHPDEAAVVVRKESEDGKENSLKLKLPAVCSAPLSNDPPIQRIGLLSQHRRASFAASIPPVKISSGKVLPAVAKENVETPATVTRKASLSYAYNDDVSARTTVIGHQSHYPDDVKKGRILLVDDSTSIIKVTKLMLQRHGYEVDTAVNGFTAVQCIEDCFLQHDPNRYEIVLMDLQMPVMDGLEAVKRMRDLELSSNNNANVKSLLIIGLSANSDDETLSTVADAGFDGFLPKPFHIEDFNRLMQQMKDASSNNPMI